VVYIRDDDILKVQDWISDGHSEIMKTPDNTIVFISEEKMKKIRNDQIECMGCLSHCKFSNWKDHGDHTTGYKPDPRSFCIQKTLQNVIMGDDIENQLMFAGHNVYKFSEDEFYKDGHIPTIQELVDRILTGY